MKQGGAYQGPKRPKEKFMLIGWHPILESLQDGRAIDRILLHRGASDERTPELLKLAKSAGVPILRVPKEKLDRLTLKNHQGAVAFISPIDYQPIDELIARSWEAGITPHFALVDGVTDVRNIGAIARSVECFGLTGLVVPMTGSAPLREDAIKSSSGALLRLPVSRVDSIDNCIEYLHKNGFETYGLTEKGDQLLHHTECQGPVAWILGDEEVGLSDAVMKRCRHLVKIQMPGQTSSLNVSVAAGIALHHHSLKAGQAAV